MRPVLSTAGYVAQPLGRVLSGDGYVVQPAPPGIGAGYGTHAPGAGIRCGNDADCCESPDVSDESLTSRPMAPLAPVSPVFALTVVLSPTETIAPDCAMTMPLP